MEQVAHVIAAASPKPLVLRYQPVLHWIQVEGSSHLTQFAEQAAHFVLSSEAPA